MPPTPLWVLGQSPLPSPLAPFCFFFALPPSFWGRRRRPRPARGGRGGGGGRGARARLVTAERGEEEEGGIKEGERGGKEEEGDTAGERGREERGFVVHPCPYMHEEDQCTCTCCTCSVRRRKEIGDAHMRTNTTNSKKVQCRRTEILWLNRNSQPQNAVFLLFL